MTGTRLHFAVVIFLARSCSSSLNRSQPNNWFPYWAAPPPCGSHAWFSFRLRCSAPMLTRTGLAGLQWILHLILRHRHNCAGRLLGIRLRRFEQWPRAPRCDNLRCARAVDRTSLHRARRHQSAVAVLVVAGRGGPVPYGLFALSNLASLLALAAYPALIEPAFTLHTQRLGWFGGFVIFALLAAGLTLRSRCQRASRNRFGNRGARVPRQPRRPRTNGSGFCCPWARPCNWRPSPASLPRTLLPIPLLWILPLGVYLLTIIIAFEFPRILPPLLSRAFLPSCWRVSSRWFRRST